MSKESALVTYYDKIATVGSICSSNPGLGTQEPGFKPGYELPPLDEKLVSFFEPATIALHRLGDYRGRQVNVLNLVGNPRTRTTKTFASLVMVARAIQHIRATGESILIVTPTSGNKGGALRDAVLRALECGLVVPDQLRIAIVVPKDSISKLWSSTLSEDAELRRLNPVFICDAEDGSIVKAMTREFVRQTSQDLKDRYNLNVWHTYDLNNYRMADAVRAFFEIDQLGPAHHDTPRIQAQAVSSAFGLLGHQFGLEFLSKNGVDVGDNRRWLLIQHLGTPDLVLDLHYGSFSRENLPAYTLQEETGLYVQNEQPFFPVRTYDVEEVIDSTFYSRNPATNELVREIMSGQGGEGIVVSLYECLQQYPKLRHLLRNTDLSLPHDPRDLREWSMTMVLTGALNAIDRDLVPSASELLIHVTGSYAKQDFSSLPADHLRPVASPDDMRVAVVEASLAPFIPKVRQAMESFERAKR
ncbi:DUF6002 family protein [Mesorhizobium escarrei]|uniref:DUF6002 family protein n=1 Tax=Mesorhizobium escarrei TaxID=666018 RepID=UPI0020A7A497|nr:DUF6002 family protein [Mesorhizobium escarrei]